MAIPSIRLVERAEMTRLVALITLRGVPGNERTPERGAEETKAQRTVENTPSHITVMDLSPPRKEERAERCLNPSPRVKRLDTELGQRLVTQWELSFEERGSLSNAEEFKAKLRAFTTFCERAPEQIPTAEEPRR